MEIAACVAVWIGGIATLAVVLWLVGLVVPRGARDPNLRELLELWRKSDRVERWALLIFALFHWSLRKAYLAIALAGLSGLSVVAGAICGWSPLQALFDELIKLLRVLRGESS
jgi:hypothetical protein